MTRHEAIQAMELVCSIADHLAKLADKHPDIRQHLLKVAEELRIEAAAYRKRHNL